MERLDTIKLQDALLDGEQETVWPEADFIVGNPPFLGNYRMREELGDEYTVKLRKLFEGRVSGFADFVCYWFEKARAQIEGGKTQRAGLIATNSIRGGANRKVLERIKDTGDIFMAWADEPWILEGAAVRVSMIAFDDGSTLQKCLDSQPVPAIHADLTSNVDMRAAKRLAESVDTSFEGVKIAGPFDIPSNTARSWIAVPNPDGVSNEDVLKLYVSAQDLVQKSKNRWVVDFNQMPLEVAAQYLAPFTYIEENVRPIREKNNERATRENWWRFKRTTPKLRQAIAPLARYIATPRHSKYRVFVWLPVESLPSDGLTLVARDDDFTFGVLPSKLHEVWSLAMGTWLGKGNDPRYTPTTCFETFPFPRPTDAQHAEIENWAKYLDTVRAQLLQTDPSRTMTKLYNDLTALRETRDSAHPVYSLLIAHDKLDAAVATAYGWEWPLADEVILERLLALNLERASQQRAAPTVAAEVAVSTVE